MNPVVTVPFDPTPAALRPAGSWLPGRSMLAVTAHPDDESFGLGGVLSTLVAQGARASLLCLTHGESSMLGADCADLGVLRPAELSAASTVLGIGDVTLLTYPDGRLPEIPMEELVDEVLHRAADVDTLLVFDANGVTGHPDHCRATEAALAAAEVLDLPVLAWAIPALVARQLNAEFGTCFVGREYSELDMVIEVNRARQLQAIACHSSQSTENPVLWRRLDLLADREWLRCLRSSQAKGGLSRRAVH